MFCCSCLTFNIIVVKMSFYLHMRFNFFYVKTYVKYICQRKTHEFTQPKKNITSNSRSKKCRADYVDEKTWNIKRIRI